MRLPTKEECYRLFSKYKTPERVIKHSEQVNKVAVIIAKALKAKGVSIDVDAIDRATLLHDMARAIDFQSFSPETTNIPIYRELSKKFGKIDHPKAAAEILAVEGYRELGQLAEKHRFSDIDKVQTHEEKIVFYADKRVSHDTIVSLPQRLDDLHVRYPDQDRFFPNAEFRKDIFNLEKEIFNKLDIKPDDIH